jgi:hypothetical protein
MMVMATKSPSPSLPVFAVLEILNVDSLRLREGESKISSTNCEEKLMDSERTAPLAGPVSRWPRRRRLRDTVIPIVTFLLGIVVGVVAIVLYALSISGNGQVLSTPSPPQSSDLVIQVGPAYITHIVDTNLRAAGLVNASNVRVTLGGGDQMTIGGDYQLPFGLSRHFTVVLQPLIASCQLKVHVLQADLGSIPITVFVAAFEGQINAQIQSKPLNLPGGFEYCQTSVRTDPQGLYVTISAKPV